MKLLPFIFPILLISCANGGSDFQVDQEIIQEYDSVRDLSSSNTAIYHSMVDNAFITIIDDDEQHLIENDSVLDLFEFVDTSSLKLPVICRGVVKDDTCYLGGGIAYGAGVGFELKIFDDSFEGEIWKLNKGLRTSNSEDYPESIDLKSIRQELIIDDTENLNPEKLLTGKLTMESEPFYREDETESHQCYLSVIFQCELRDGGYSKY